MLGKLLSIVFLMFLFWDSEPVTVDFTLSEFDKSSTSSVFKSRFNEVKHKYLDFVTYTLMDLKLKQK